MDQTDQVLKVDAAGRVWTPRAKREEVLDELERSGMAAVKFAAFIGVKYPTLASWVQKRRRQRKADAAGGPACGVAVDGGGGGGAMPEVAHGAAGRCAHRDRG